MKVNVNYYPTNFVGVLLFVMNFSSDDFSFDNLMLNISFLTCFGFMCINIHSNMFNIALFYKKGCS